jgi:Na+/proline symporter
VPKLPDFTYGTYIAGMDFRNKYPRALIAEMFSGGIMRDIFRPDTLRREVIPLAVFALIVAVIFLIALFNNLNLVGADLAVTWTMRATGGLIAVVATFGLFWRALNGEPLEMQFGFVLALLAGLLLVSVHWSLAIALGIIGVALIAREVWLRYSPGAGASGADYSPPVDRPMP